MRRDKGLYEAACFRNQTAFEAALGGLISGRPHGGTGFCTAASPSRKSPQAQAPRCTISQNEKPS